MGTAPFVLCSQSQIKHRFDTSSLTCKSFPSLSASPCPHGSLFSHWYTTHETISVVDAWYNLSSIFSQNCLSPNRMVALLFKKSVLLGNNLYTAKFTNFKSTVEVFYKSIKLCNHHQNNNIEHLHSPQRILSYSFTFNLFLPSLATICLLFLTILLSFSKFHIKELT